MLRRRIIAQGLSAPPPPPPPVGPLLELPPLEEEPPEDEEDELDDELLEEDEELVTVSVTAELLAVPVGLVRTQRNWSPDMVRVAAKTVSVLVVTPEYVLFSARVSQEEVLTGRRCH